MISVLDFGMKGDGVTDDAAAIQRAIDAVARSGGGGVVLGPVHRLSRALIVPRGVVIQSGGGV